MVASEFTPLLKRLFTIIGVLRRLVASGGFRLPRCPDSLTGAGSMVLFPGWRPARRDGLGRQAWPRDRSEDVFVGPEIRRDWNAGLHILMEAWDMVPWVMEAWTWRLVVSACVAMPWRGEDMRIPARYAEISAVHPARPKVVPIVQLVLLSERPPAGQFVRLERVKSEESAVEGGADGRSSNDAPFWNAG